MSEAAYNVNVDRTFEVEPNGEPTTIAIGIHSDDGGDGTVVYGAYLHVIHPQGYSHIRLDVVELEQLATEADAALREAGLR